VLLEVLSVNIIAVQELGRHDDLMSLFYIIVEFACGQLPWRRLTDKEEVRRAKEEYDHTHMLQCLPGPPFKEFLHELQNLDYFIDPDYDLLRRRLHECMEFNGVRDDDPFDWEMPAASSSTISAQPTPEKAADSAPGYLYCLRWPLLQNFQRYCNF